jgi:hypothetical protein
MGHDIADETPAVQMYAASVSERMTAFRQSAFREVKERL